VTETEICSAHKAFCKGLGMVLGATRRMDARRRHIFNAADGTAFFQCFCILAEYARHRCSREAKGSGRGEL
jgi:hypothetical protein